MTPDVWVSRRTLYDSSIVYHCYIVDDNVSTNRLFVGFYLNHDGTILQGDTLYDRYNVTTESITYYSLLSIEGFEALIERYYDHKQDMIEIVNQQFNQLLLSALL